MMFFSFGRSRELSATTYLIVIYYLFLHTIVIGLHTIVIGLHTIVIGLHTIVIGLHLARKGFQLQ
jgi:hypothetical protein